MYNKLFTKILDSSIWLEDLSTRIVWITFLAAMDEEGFASFSSIENLAYRARVSEEQAKEAVERLEAADPKTPEDEFQGRRVERVPGGWMILKAPYYRDLVSRERAKECTRERVARFRAKKNVTECNANVTPCNAVKQNVTPSRSRSEAYISSSFETFWKEYPRRIGKGAALKSWKKLKLDDVLIKVILESLAVQRNSKQWRDVQYIPHPATWLNQRRWEDEVEGGFKKPPLPKQKYDPFANLPKPAPPLTQEQIKKAQETYNEASRV